MKAECHCPGKLLFALYTGFQGNRLRSSTRFTVSLGLIQALERIGQRSTRFS